MQIMARVYIIKLLFIVFVLCAFSKGLDAQTTIELKDHPEWEKKTYNLAGSELYLIINKDTLFVPKISPFIFRTNRAIDSTFGMVDTLASIEILIRNSVNEFAIPLPHFLFRTQTPFRVSIYRDNSKNYYSIFLLNTHSVGFCMSNLLIKPNSLWKRKYLK